MGEHEERSERQAEQLAEFLQREVTRNPEFLKRRYLWLTPAILKHTTDAVSMFHRRLALLGPIKLTEQQTSHLLFESFILSYAVAILAADQLVQNKCGFDQNKCDQISQEPLLLTFQMCESWFKCLDHTFEEIFDVYAGYQYLRIREMESHVKTIQTSEMVSDALNRVKVSFGINTDTDFVSQHFAERVVKMSSRLAKDELCTFIESHITAPALLITLDAFHLEQEKVDEAILLFLNNIKILA